MYRIFWEMITFQVEKAVTVARLQELTIKLQTFIVRIGLPRVISKIKQELDHSDLFI